jgi:hypothetical protein
MQDGDQIVKRKPSLRVGAHFRFLSKYRLCHVLGLVATDDGRLITYKWWNPSSGWIYECRLAEEIDQARFAVRGAGSLSEARTDQLPFPTDA